mmetsp:Transcript_473/g.1326  ORF Transcript_473/g.1326 Transcript_473/m.1326 type:complete len:453 (-) Transcript_473:279-1637(-)
MLLLNIHGKAQDLENPAFSVYHPRLPVVYTCSENIYDNGRIFAFSVGEDGSLTQLGEPIDAGGTSTCYLTIDHSQKHMLAVNYWDSTLVVIPLDYETGRITGPIQSCYDPKGGDCVVAAGRSKGGVNHSDNDAKTIEVRQKDPHSHALELDPYVGTLAYVPCLGKDVVREFFYNRKMGEIGMELNTLPSGLRQGMADGPRYFEFHPKLPIAYCINEFSATVAVFEVNRDLLEEMAQASDDGQDMNQFKGRSTLRLIQSIKTIPSAFPTSMNTCGRICVHKSGRFVLVANRGHQSIAIFRVIQKGPKKGELKTIGYFHTRGETPRHFNFDASGQYLIVANQDTDTIAIFNFNLSSGEITFTGNEYGVPSPNFVCCCPLSGVEDSVDEHVGQLEDTVMVPRKKSDAADDNASSASDGSSTVPTELPAQKDLIDELKRAREEIASLKEQLSAVKP